VQSGRFIVLEGIDASGTTTQCKALAEALRERGHQVIETFEPSRGQIGKQIREWLSVSADAPGARALALLFAADRIDHLNREVLPALEAGKTVICDRYLWSSFAYQGLDCDLSWVRQINSQARIPDLALWLEIPVDVALARCQARLAEGEAVAERFDGEALQRRLHDAYARFAQNPDDELCAIDANAEVDTVTAALLDACVQIGM
jgi:dTMP kinase